MKFRALWPFLVIALVAFIPTWRFIFGGQVPAPVDQVHQLPPWNGKASPNEWDILQLDGALQFLPWRHYMLDAMRHDFVPLWNPYTFGGTPFLANSQSAPMYPLHWLWPFDAESLLGFSAWLHLVIAGFGAFLLCKRLGSDDRGGVIAGTAIALSAFMVGWLQLPSVQMTAAWIPWCLLGVFRLFDEPNPKSVAKLGASIALMLLAGHLQIAAFGVLATLLAVVWLLVTERKAKCLLLSVAAFGLGLSLAAPQLLPVLENAKNGHRAGSASEEGWKSYQGQAIKPQMLVTLFDPAHFGHPQWGEGLTGYWLSIKEPGRNYAESAWFVGPIILPLALLALLRSRRNPRAMLLAVISALAILIALGTVVAKAAYFYLPGWSATGSPGRAAILFAIPVCVLAGFAFRREDNEPIPKWAALLALALGAGGLLWAKLTFTTTPVEGYGIPSSTLGLAMMLTVPGLLGLLAISFAPSKWKGVGAGVMLASQLVLLSLVHADLNPGSPRGRYIEAFHELDHLKGHTVAVVNDNWSMFGLAAGASAPPNSLMPYGITEVGGYDSIIPKRIKQRLDDINGRDSATFINGNMLFVKPGFDKAKLRALGVEYVIAGYNLDLPIDHDEGTFRLYKLPGPKPETPVLSSRYNEKLLRWNERRAESKEWLGSEEADGWEMSLFSLDYPKGTVTAIYRPHSYRLGFLLSLFGISALIALLSFGRRLEVVCPNCKSSVDINDQFCRTCGTTIASGRVSSETEVQSVSGASSDSDGTLHARVEGSSVEHLQPAAEPCPSRWLLALVVLLQLAELWLAGYLAGQVGAAAMPFYFPVGSLLISVICAVGAFYGSRYLYWVLVVRLGLGTIADVYTLWTAYSAYLPSARAAQAAVSETVLMAIVVDVIASLVLTIALIHEWAAYRSWALRRVRT